MNLTSTSPIQWKGRGGRRRATVATGRRLMAVTLVFVGALAIHGHPVSAATEAATATIGNPTSVSALDAGGSATVFTVRLPDGAKCSGDTAKQGYHVFSYLVPKGTSAAVVKFINFPDQGFGFVDNTGTYYGSVNTAIDTGQIIGIPTNFSWGPLTVPGGGTVELADLTGGTSKTWEGGIACAKDSVVSDWWGTDITFTATAADPLGFTWTATAGVPTPAPGAATTTTLPKTTTTKKPVKTVTTTTNVNSQGGSTTTTAAGATTTTQLGGTATTTPDLTGTGTDGFTDTSGSDFTGSLPRTGSSTHREVGLGLFAIGAGMMLIGLDLRWKARAVIFS
jgi:hypothetical protein